MSRINGDKSRFNRLRKQKIARRDRLREILERGAEPKKPAGSASAKPKAMPA